MADARTLLEDVLHRRLIAFDEQRAFFIEMWLQNPGLAANAGSKITDLLKPLPEATSSER